MLAQLTQGQDLPAVRLVDHRRGNPFASRRPACRRRCQQVADAKLIHRLAVPAAARTGK